MKLNRFNIRTLLATTLFAAGAFAILESRSKTNQHAHLGTVAAGVKVHHEFKIHNSRNCPLRVRLGSGGWNDELDTDIVAPLETATLNVTFTVDPKWEAISRRYQVLTDNPENPVIVFTLSGEIDTDSRF